MKKLLSILLTFAILTGCFSVSVSAANTDVVFSGFETPVLYESSYNHKETAENALSDYVTLSNLKTALLNGISNCQTTINISEFKIDYNQTTKSAIAGYVCYGIPEAFNVHSVGFSYDSASMKILNMIVVYKTFSDQPSEYQACMKAISDAGDELLEGIENNGQIGDIEKALLIHDRLALWNEYDYGTTIPDESFTAYGALGEKVSVCQGYAMAYMYLLNRVGIENYYCSSEVLNHGWNIVYIGDKAYHVDVTWDDYAWGTGERGAVGVVGHSNFLRSSNGIYATGHEATDYDTTPNDTTYDNYFWQNSETAFQLADNELYYIDNDNANLIRYSDGTILCSVDDTWKYNDYYYWGNNARLSSDGVSLYYSLTKAIYKFDLATNTSKKIYEPSLLGYNSIYGFMYYDNYLICDINNAPPYSAYGISNLYPVKVLYEEKTPSDSNGGDINGDGKTNNKDLGLLMQYLNGWDVAISDTVADVNGDGRINNKDYGLLMQFVNGWDVVLK